MQKYSDEILQLNLSKLRETILDPATQSEVLYSAGCQFIKYLFGEKYVPDENEVSLIVHFICSNQDISMDRLINVSTNVVSHRADVTKTLQAT